MAYYTPDRASCSSSRDRANTQRWRQLIEELYAQDPFGAGRLIESIRWELPSSWRKRRAGGATVGCGTLAFPVRGGGRILCAASAASIRGIRRAATQALIAPSGPLLDAALERLDGDDLESAEEAIVYAQTRPCGESGAAGRSDEVREQLGDARATLSLGLELLSGGDPARAARILVEKPIRSVFQAAMGEAYRCRPVEEDRGAGAAAAAQSATCWTSPWRASCRRCCGRGRRSTNPASGVLARSARGGDRAREALLDEAEATLALLSTRGSQRPASQKQRKRGWGRGGEASLACGR